MAANQIPAATVQSRRKRRWGRKLLLLMVLVSAGYVLTRYATRRAGAPESVFQTTLEDGYPQIVKAMSVVALQSPGTASMPVTDVLRVVATEGFRRLDDQSLLRLTSLRADLAQQSDLAICAGLWSGDPPNLVPAIETLPDAQQREWAQLFDQAAIATINHTALLPAPSPAQFQLALNRTVAAMPSADFDLIKSVLDDPRHKSQDIECQAARTLYAAIERGNQDDAVTIARGLIYQ
jgi:hypothetical protein